MPTTTEKRSHLRWGTVTQVGIAKKFRADLATLPGPIARKAAVFAWAVVVANDAFSEKGPPDEVRATCNGIRESRRHVGMALAGEVDSFGDR